ncbi:hypothetical protein Tco_0456282 [Tanacetum coccineum]
MDTAYGRRWIRRIGNCEYAFSCEDLALIRRISFPGYGVLVRNEYVTVSGSQYVVFNGTEYAVLIFLNEYAVLDRKFDTPYPMEVDTPHRYAVSSLMDTAYWLSEQSEVGVDYGGINARIAFPGYGVLDLVSFVVFGECRHRYAVSSLMDTAYWLSEQ